MKKSIEEQLTKENVNLAYKSIGDEGVLFLSAQHTHHVRELWLGTITLTQMAMASLGEECRALPDVTGPHFM